MMRVVDSLLKVTESGEGFTMRYFLRGSWIKIIDCPVGSSALELLRNSNFTLTNNVSSNSTDSNVATHPILFSVIEIIVGTVFLALLFAFLYICVWFITTENSRGICLLSMSRIAPPPPPPPPEFEIEASPSQRKRSKPTKDKSSKGRKRSISHDSVPTDLIDDLEEVPILFSDIETKSGKSSRQNSFKKSNDNSGKSTSPSTPSAKKKKKEEENKVNRKKSVSFKL